MLEFVRTRLAIRIAAAACVPSIFILAPGCVATPIGRAGAATHEHDYDPERAFLTLARIEPDPTAPEAPGTPPPGLSTSSIRRLNRAQERYRQHRFTEAAIELEKALRRDPDHPRLHRELARTLHAAGNVERARAHLRKALAADPDDVVSHYLLGRLATEDGRNAESITHFRTALKASNVSAEPAFAALTFFYLARVLNAEGYLTAAIEAYRAYQTAAAALPPDARAEPQISTLLQVNRGRAGGPISVAYEKLELYAEAADALAGTLRDQQPDPDTRERLARLLARSDRMEEALRHARMLRDHPHRAVSLLIELHQQAGHPQLVVDDVRLMYQQQPDDTGLLLAYVDVLTRFGHLSQAEQALRHAPGGRHQSPDVHWRLSDVLRQQHKWAPALAAAAEGLRTDPELYDNARTRAIILADHDDAVVTLLGQHQSADQPGDYAAAYLLGVLANHVNRPDQARSLLQRSLELRPGFIPARLALAHILLARFKWQEVIDLVSANDDLLQHHGDLQRLCGQAHAGLDDFEAADRHLSEAVRLNRTDTAAMVARADLLRDRGDFRRAQRQYDAVLKLNPLHERSREALFEMYLFDFEQDRSSDAAAQLTELRRLSASPHVIARCTARLDLGEGHHHRDWEKYRTTLNDAIQHQGPDAKTYELIARSHLQQDHAEQALTAILKAIELQPDDAELRHGSVFAYNALLRYDDAVDTMLSLLKRHPNRTRWIERLLAILLIDHRFDQAYDRATELLNRPDLSNDDRGKYRDLALESLQRAKRYDHQIALLQQWRAEEPGEQKWTWTLVYALQTAERHDDAIALARIEYERSRELAIRNELRIVYRNAARYEQAEQLLLDSLEDDPDNPDLIEKLIQTLTLADRHDDALELIENLAVRAEFNPNWIRSLKLVVLDNADRHDDAMKLLNKWVRELQADGSDDGEVEQVRNRMAVSLVRAHKIDEAVSRLRRWIETTPSKNARFEYLSRLSVCYQFRAQPQLALETLEEAFDLVDQLDFASARIRLGRRVGVHNDFGYSLADAGLRLQEAERLIRYALVNAPSNGAYLDSFGWVLYKKGDFESARRWLQKAAQSVRGDDPVVNDHLGDTLWRLGRRDQALGRWSTAVEMAEEVLKDWPRADLQRLLDQVKGKIDAAKNNRSPSVAPVAPPESDADGTKELDTPASS